MLGAGVARRAVEPLAVPHEPALGQRVEVGAPDDLRDRLLEAQLRQGIRLPIAVLTPEHEAARHASTLYADGKTGHQKPPVMPRRVATFHARSLSPVFRLDGYGGRFQG